MTTEKTRNKAGRPRRDAYVAASFTLSRSLADKVLEETTLRQETITKFFERAVRRYFETDDDAISRDAFKLILIRSILDAE